jgi:hypothetical protein
MAFTSRQATASSAAFIAGIAASSSLLASALHFYAVVATSLVASA